LFSIHSNYPDFSSADFAVNPDKGGGGGRRAWDEGATQDALTGLDLFMQFVDKRNRLHAWLIQQSN
jgi:hypothetical protein